MSKILIIVNNDEETQKLYSLVNDNVIVCSIERKEFSIKEYYSEVLFLTKIVDKDQQNILSLLETNNCIDDQTLDTLLSKPTIEEKETSESKERDEMVKNSYKRITKKEIKELTDFKNKVQSNFWYKFIKKKM